MPEGSSVFTSKIGGQPAWVWIGAGGVVVGGFLWWRHRQAQNQASSSTTSSTGATVPTAATSEELMAAGLYQPPNITYNVPSPNIDNGIQPQQPGGAVKPAPGSLVSLNGGQEYYTIVNGHLMADVLGQGPLAGVYDLGPVPPNSTGVTATGGNSGVNVTTYDSNGNPTYNDVWNPSTGWTGPITKAPNQTSLFPPPQPSATTPPQTGTGAARGTLPSLHMAPSRFPRRGFARSTVRNPAIGKSPAGAIRVA